MDICGHPVDLSTTNLLRAGLRICGYLPACLPTWFTDSRRYSRRKCVPTSRTRLRGRLGSLDTARHGTEQLGSGIYSAVSTSGRGKGVPRRSYTHATRRRRSMAEKERRPTESRATIPKLRSWDRPVSLLNPIWASSTTLNQANVHANEYGIALLWAWKKTTIDKSLIFLTFDRVSFCS